MNKKKTFRRECVKKRCQAKNKQCGVGNAITRWGKAGLGHDGDRGSRHREMAPPTQPRANYNLNWCRTKPFHKERDELAAKCGQSQKKFHRYRVRSFPETPSVNSGRE